MTETHELTEKLAALKAEMERLKQLADEASDKYDQFYTDFHRLKHEWKTLDEAEKHISRKNAAWIDSGDARERYHAAYMRYGREYERVTGKPFWPKR